MLSSTSKYLVTLDKNYPRFAYPKSLSTTEVMLKHRRRLGLTYFFPILFLGTLNKLFFFQGLLISCNQMSADYLFQKDKHYDVCYDTGDKVIQCGRHNDIFKLWLQWRSRVRTKNMYLHCTIWHYRLWSFKTRDTKLERFLHKNQHTQRKLLNFENWTNGEPQQLAKIRVFKVDYFDFSCIKLEKLV